jgi:FkbM family methyltransferase
MYTNIPGRKPIELVAHYPQFAAYYPNCEMATKQWFVDNVKPDWVLLDIGANIGYYTVLFAQLASKGMVHAVEPTKTHLMLSENLKHNGITNARVYQDAMGASTGVIKDGIFRIWGVEPEVSCYDFITLDDFVKREKLNRIDAIKIDVDSYDFEVLQGAVETMKQFNPYIMVELNYALGKRKQTAAQALQWLAQQGYKDPPVYGGENYLLKR